MLTVTLSCYTAPVSSCRTRQDSFLSAVLSPWGCGHSWATFPQCVPVVKNSGWGCAARPTSSVTLGKWLVVRLPAPHLLPSITAFLYREACLASECAKHSAHTSLCGRPGPAAPPGAWMRLCPRQQSSLPPLKQNLEMSSVLPERTLVGRVSLTFCRAGCRAPLCRFSASRVAQTCSSAGWRLPGAAVTPPLPGGSPCDGDS